MSITHRDAVTLLLDRFPGFRPYWEEHRRWWNGAATGPCLDLAEFALYAAAVIAGEDEGALPVMFATVEELLVSGDEEVATAAATCCLENIMNRTPPLDPSRFVHLLGPKSRDYCRAWDEFCGVRTAGLWDE